MKDYKRGIFAGSEGLEPNALKYMWPGVVAQSVEASVNGEEFIDPESGKGYSIHSFHPHAVGLKYNDRFEIVPPLVVKPDPFLESVQVRSQLHAAAIAARASAGGPRENSKSHYRLYCFTDPQIGLQEVAPLSAGWAAGTLPSVCSSFIWCILSKHGVHFETESKFVMPGDLERKDVSQGAFVMPATPDGLYTYTAEERLTGANFLYDTVYHQAYEKAGWLGNIATDAADDVANQIVNTFVSDDADSKDSKEWQSMEDANAVSPENILWWDSPPRGLYGFAEPLIYREPRLEKYKVSRWKKVLTRGSISGMVTYKGIPVKGASVQVYDGKSTVTNDDGH